MPGGNGTGPMGQGPMTGHGAGYCTGSGTSGFAFFGAVRGSGGDIGRRNRFFGRRQGFRRNFWPVAGTFAPYGNPDPELERQALKRHADDLQAELEIIKKRLSEIE